MIDKLLILHLLVNAVIATRYWTDSLPHGSRYEQTINGITFVFFLFFGIEFIALCYLYDLGKEFCKFFQVGFFITFYFTKKYYNLPEDDLYRVNNSERLYFNTNSLRHRIYRKCTDMVNKRNNYTFVEREPNF